MSELVLESKGGIEVGVQDFDLGKGAAFVSPPLLSLRRFHDFQHGPTNTPRFSALFCFP